MKKFNKIKYASLANNDGVREWVNPEVIQENLSMEQRHADDINAQFSNTGILLEEIVEGEVIVGVEDTAPNGINVGDQIGTGLAPAITAPSISGNPEDFDQPDANQITEQPVVIVEENGGNDTDQEGSV